MVLSLRSDMVESNGKQVEEDINFVDHLQRFENKKGQALTAMEIQGIKLEYNEYVMNYFMYHQQSNSIEEYETSFLQLKCWAETWSEEFFYRRLGCEVFVRGLREEIRKYVEWCSPNSLQRSVDLAKQQELCHATKVFDKSSQSNQTTNFNLSSAENHDAPEVISITVKKMIKASLSGNVSMKGNDISLVHKKFFNSSFSLATEYPTQMDNESNLLESRLGLNGHIRRIYGAAQGDELYVEDKLFDKNPKCDKYIPALEPKPPYHYDTQVDMCMFGLSIISNEGVEFLNDSDKAYYGSTKYYGGYSNLVISFGKLGKLIEDAGTNFMDLFNNKFDEITKKDENSGKSDLKENIFYRDERRKFVSILLVPYVLNNGGWTALLYTEDEDKRNLEVAENLKNDHETSGGKYNEVIDKSRGLLTQNFFMLWFCSNVEVIFLDEATKTFHKDVHDMLIMGTKVRGLYDIVNEWSSMNLTEKTHHSKTRRPLNLGDLGALVTLDLAQVVKGKFKMKIENLVPRYCWPGLIISCDNNGVQKEEQVFEWIERGGQPNTGKGNWTKFSLGNFSNICVTDGHWREGDDIKKDSREFSRLLAGLTSKYLQEIQDKFGRNRAGLVAAESPNHYGTIETIFTACLPNLVVMDAKVKCYLIAEIVVSKMLDMRGRIYIALEDRGEFHLPSAASKKNVQLVRCLKLLDGLLRKCQYHVTTTSQASAALRLLRENRNIFDLIIRDVHMPDRDGFKLLELVGLEMDLPVIMLSADSDPKFVMNGITHGACDYLVKPVRIKELRNIWQHVIRRKKMDSKSHDKSNSQDGYQQGSEGGQGPVLIGNAVQNGNVNRKRKDEEEEGEENEHDDDDPSTQQKPRVVWSIELHRTFVAAVNQLGLEKAIPKRILDLMNVEGFTKENVDYVQEMTSINCSSMNINNLQAVVVKIARQTGRQHLIGFNGAPSIVKNDTDI